MATVAIRQADLLALQNAARAMLAALADAENLLTMSSTAKVERDAVRERINAAIAAAKAAGIK